jgi:hypothetical protein
MEMENRTVSRNTLTFLYKAMFVAYCLLALIEAMRYISGGDKYRFLLCIFAPAIPLAVILIFRVLKLRFTWHLNLIILGFTMLAYMIGSCVDLYHSVPGYDKFVHAMSGAFISLLTCVAYYFIKPSHSIEAIDARLLPVFVFTGSMAIAGLWEIWEYLMSGLTGQDLQFVAATGVSDTMQDMICCLIGTVAFLPSAIRLSRGRGDWLTGAVSDFIQENYGSN